MVNFNGTLVDQANAFISADNRGYQYGDAVFETIHVWRSNILFLEDHYFRLMSGMRILRMAIPMSFTMEFIEREIQKPWRPTRLLTRIIGCVSPLTEKLEGVIPQ